MKIGMRHKIALFYKSPKTAWSELVGGLRGAGNARFPRVIDLFVTERCNFSCPMCHVGDSMAKNYSGEDLGFEYLEKAVRESKKWSPVFQIIGGEPTLYKHLVELIRLISANRMICGLTTNGFLLEQMAEDIVGSGLNFLAVSLDGWDEASQSKRGNVPGSFARAIRGIERVKAARKGNVFPIIRIATVISKDNYAHLDKIAEVVKGLKVDKWSLSNHFFLPDSVIEKNKAFCQSTGIGEDIWAHKIGKGYYFSDEETVSLQGFLDRLRQRFSRDLIIDYDWSIRPEKFYSGIFPAKTSKCLFPYQELMLRGNGDLELCQGFKLGNIRSDSIYDVYNGEKIKYFRNVFRSVNLMPACFRCCALDMSF